MSLVKDSEEANRLIDSSSISGSSSPGKSKQSDVVQVSTVNESPTPSFAKKNKFLIVKLNGESSNPKTLTDAFSSEVASAKTDDNNNLSQAQNKSGQTFDEANEDDDDVFDADMLDNFVTMNKDYRESEGQDTITSLTNNIYK